MSQVLYSVGQNQDTEAVEAGSLTNLEGSELRGIGRSFDLSVLGGKARQPLRIFVIPDFRHLVWHAYNPVFRGGLRILNV